MSCVHQFKPEIAVLHFAKICHKRGIHFMLFYLKPIAFFTMFDKK